MYILWPLLKIGTRVITIDACDNSAVTILNGNICVVLDSAGTYKAFVQHHQCNCFLCMYICISNTMVSEDILIVQTCSPAALESDCCCIAVGVYSS